LLAGRGQIAHVRHHDSRPPAQVAATPMQTGPQQAALMARSQRMRVASRLVLTISFIAVCQVRLTISGSLAARYSSGGCINLSSAWIGFPKYIRRLKPTTSWRANTSGWKFLPRLPNFTKTPYRGEHRIAGMQLANYSHGMKRKISFINRCDKIGSAAIS
jgi:hypothetical protein